MKTLQLTFTNRSPKENDELFKTPNRFTSNKLKKIFMLRHKVKSDMEAPLRLTTYSNAAKYTVLYNDFQNKCFGTQTMERSKVQEWLFIMEK